MSGHSKWANIKNKKAKTDAAKGKIFTKIGRELAVAAKAGADPSTNSKLADVIAKAKAANMPNDNITRSIKKAAGELGNVNYENKIYEFDPFSRLDVKGVGKLMELAVNLGRGANKNLHVGICGEHGGDPSSIEFCHSIGLDYVSCSPYRVPIARIAAAQANIRNPRS